MKTLARQTTIRHVESIEQSDLPSPFVELELTFEMDFEIHPAETEAHDTPAFPAEAVLVGMRCTQARWKHESRGNGVSVPWPHESELYCAMLRNGLSDQRLREFGRQAIDEAGE